MGGWGFNSLYFLGDTPEPYNRGRKLKWKGIKLVLGKDSKHCKFKCCSGCNSESTPSESTLVLQCDQQEATSAFDVFRKQTTDNIEGGYFLNRYGKRRKCFDDHRKIGSSDETFDEMEQIFQKISQEEQKLDNKLEEAAKFRDAEKIEEEDKYEDWSCDLFDSYTDMYSTQASQTSGHRSQYSSKEQPLLGSSHGYSEKSYDIQELCKPGRIGKFNILALVLQVNAEDVVALKNGDFATFTSLLVADEQSQYVQLTFWHHMKEWVNKIDSGSVILVTGVIQKCWKDKLSLATTDESKLFNFHQPKEPFPKFWGTVIRAEVLKDFVCLMKKKYNTMFEGDKARYVQSLGKAHTVGSFESLMPGTIVNFIGSVISINVFPNHSKKGALKQKKQPFIVLSLRDGHEKKASMFVWGNRTTLLSTLRKYQGLWMEFSSVAVKSGLSGDVLELHSISSTKISLTQDSDVFDVRTNVWPQWKSSVTGNLENIKGHVTGLEITDRQGRCGRVSVDTFKGQQREGSWDAMIEASNVLEKLTDLRYIGCRQCFCELEQSPDGTTHACERCLSLSWKYDFSKVETLRPFRLLVKTKCRIEVPVMVFPDVFNRLKSSDLIENVFYLSKVATHGLENKSELTTSCEKIFDGKERVFLVLQENTGETDTVIREEVYLLKDIEEL